MDSGVGTAIWDTEEMSAEDLLCRNEELIWLAKQDQRRGWKLINGRIADSGHPTAALGGGYGALQAYPPNAAQTSTAVTTATPGTTIWTVSIYSPILANAVMAPSAYRLAASGTVQTSTSALTLTTLPSIGSGSVNAAPTNHQDLGVTGTCALGSTLTSIWRLEADLTIRSVGTAGTAWLMGTLWVGQTAVPVTGGANVLSVLMGGTAATVDFSGATASVPGGLQISMWGAATVTLVTQSVHFTSWN